MDYDTHERLRELELQNRELLQEIETLRPERVAAPIDQLESYHPDQFNAVLEAIFTLGLIGPADLLAKVQ